MRQPGAARAARAGIGAAVRAAVRARLRHPAGEPRGTAASSALRAASLLRGGVPANRVWRVLGERPGAPAELRALAALIARGRGSAEALGEVPGEEWRVLATAWRLAEQSGAPLATVLERLAQALDALERLGERRSVLIAGPRATMRLVAALPPLALLLGALLGFDPVGVLLGPLGALLGGIGLLLLGLGVWWAERLVSRLASADWIAGLECELAWVALGGGGPPHAALRRVADCADLSRASWVRLSALVRGGPVRTVLGSAAGLGTPAGPLLLAEARGERARALAGLEREAERLAVRMLLPIALCVLPSFVVLGVLPVLLAVLGSLGPLGPVEG